MTASPMRTRAGAKLTPVLVGSVLCACLGGLGIYAYCRKVPAKPVHGAGVAALRSDLEQLRAELKALKGLDRSDRLRATLLSRAGSTPDTLVAAAASAEPEGASVERAAQGVLEPEDVVARNGELVARRTESLEQHLTHEGRDVAWAPVEQARITSLVSEMDPEQFQSTKLASVDCATTMCKVRVVHGSMQEQSDFVDAFRLGIAASMFAKKEDGPDRGRYAWVFYTARRGHSLPRPPG